MDRGIQYGCPDLVSPVAKTSRDGAMLEERMSMPRSKKPESMQLRARQAPPGANGPPGDVLTLAEAAAYLRLSEAEVLRLVDEQGLPARQVGKERWFLKAAIQQWLSAGSPPVPEKEAQLAVAGSWEDDPLVEEELSETLRRRGRS
jgi:excisionase family DNA binding protein